MNSFWNIIKIRYLYLEEYLLKNSMITKIVKMLSCVNKIFMNMTLFIQLMWYFYIFLGLNLTVNSNKIIKIITSNKSKNSMTDIFCWPLRIKIYYYWWFPFFNIKFKKHLQENWENYFRHHNWNKNTLNNVVTNNYLLLNFLYSYYNSNYNKTSTIK